MSKFTVGEKVYSYSHNDFGIVLQAQPDLIVKFREMEFEYNPRGYYKNTEGNEDIFSLDEALRRKKISLSRYIDAIKGQCKKAAFRDESGYFIPERLFATEEEARNYAIDKNLVFIKMLETVNLE